MFSLFRLHCSIRSFGSSISNSIDPQFLFPACIDSMKSIVVSWSNCLLTPSKCPFLILDLTSSTDSESCLSSGEKAWNWSLEFILTFEPKSLISIFQFCSIKSARTKIADLWTKEKLLAWIDCSCFLKAEATSIPFFVKYSMLIRKIAILFKICWSSSNCIL